MSPRFTDDDVDKIVENASGEVIGTVTGIEDDTARVRPSSGVLDSIRARLGWKRAQEDTVLIHEDAVVEVTTDVIRLEADSGRTDTEATAATEIDEPSRTSGTVSSESDVESDEDESEGERADEPAPTTRTVSSDSSEDESESGPETRPGSSVDRYDPADETEIPGPDGTSGGHESAGGSEVSEPDPSRTGGEIRESADAEDIAESRAAGGSDSVETRHEGDDEHDAGEAVSGAAEREGADDRPETETGMEMELEPETEMGVKRDDETETQERDLTDELDAGVHVDSSEVTSEREDADEIEGPPESESESEGESDRGIETKTETETENASSIADVDPGPDIGALEETDETEARGRSPTVDEDADGGAPETEAEPDPEEMDLADELNQGVATESDEVAGTAPDAPMPSDGDVSEEIDTGIDLEAAVSSGESESESESDLETGEDETRERRTAESRSELESGSGFDAGQKPGSEPELESPLGTDFATARPETADTIRTDREDDPTSDRHLEVARALDRTVASAEAIEGETQSEREEGTRDRSPRRTTTAAGSPFAPQRIVFEQGITVQRNAARLTRTALEAHTSVQRQNLEFASLVMSAPLSAAATMMESASREHRHDVDDGGRTPNRARRLELLDGIDSMYRDRLEEAGITSLDDLAGADVETVADAAGVTEKRARSWIERVDV